MTQEIGETRNAIIEDDEKVVQAILNANTHRQGKYWIVIFAKQARGHVDGKPTLVKHIKAYPIKPTPKVGMIVGEVDNQKGTITWDVNMPQVPFDFDALRPFAKGEDQVVVETTSIANAYVTK